MASMFSETDKICDHSSSSSPRRRYDVFLSFRGVDTRDNFADYLYRALLEKGIHTFRDDDEIEGGKVVMTELMEAIKESVYSVIVISPNYASSSWCLNELVQILECSGTPGHTVYAVFYHVDPSDVRKQTGKFGQGFSQAVSKSQTNGQRWKEALEETASLKGWVYPSPGYGAEQEFIDALSGDIFDKLKDTYPNPLEGLVGMTSRMNTLNNLLNLGSDEAQMVGIWGMGGIGKTTIAKVVYHSISGQFEGCSFIENVREVGNKSGLKALQEQLISNTLKKKDFKLESVMSGTSIIRNRVCHKKVLIVLDDVDASIELENLIGELHWFCNGSRIIITTRDRHMLTLLGVKDVYEIQELNIDESKELFISKAFAEDREIGEFQGLISRAIEYAKGIPLALKVLGSFLLGLKVRQWESALVRLRESPGDKVQQVLRISYDGLHRDEKEIFLDICCFFRGKDKDETINVLGACGFNPDIGIYVLVQKSLLTISEINTVGMHDLVQKMGWTIVQEESTKTPGKRSRLWCHGDIKRVLTENTGTERIEGIYDHDSAVEAEDLQLKPNAFAKMTNMRVLKIRSRSLKTKYKCSSIDLPNMLRYLHWHGCPLKCLSSTFQPEHLVELYLTYSRLGQIWDGKMVLPKLTILDLSHSTCLTKSPDFTGFSNLEKLCLVGCTALRNLHPSIKELEKLVILNLKGCSSLKTIPYGIKSPCLKFISFSGCFKLTKVVERFGDLKQLLELYLDGTGITEVPPSIGNATNVCYLDLSRCKNLKRIPSSIGQLKKLKKLFLVDCSSLNELPEEVRFIENLELLSVTGSVERQLPLSVCLGNLLYPSLNGSRILTLRSILRPLLCYLCVISCKVQKRHDLFPRPFVVPVGFGMAFLSGFISFVLPKLINRNLKSTSESISCCLPVKTLSRNENEIESLPAIIKLEKVRLEGCRKLNVWYLLASGCELLKTWSLSLFQDARKVFLSEFSELVGNKEIEIHLREYIFSPNQLKVNNNEFFRVDTSKIPKWFTYQNVGASLTFQLPETDLHSPNLFGFAVSAVVSTYSTDCELRLQISIGDEIRPDYRNIHCKKNSVDLYILYIPIHSFSVDSFRQGGMDFKLCYHVSGLTSMVDEVCEPAPEVKSCGACFIYKDDRFTVTLSGASGSRRRRIRVLRLLQLFGIILLLLSRLLKWIAEQ